MKKLLPCPLVVAGWSVRSCFAVALSSSGGAVSQAGLCLCLACLSIQTCPRRWFVGHRASSWPCLAVQGPVQLLWPGGWAARLEPSHHLAHGCCGSPLAGSSSCCWWAQGREAGVEEGPKPLSAGSAQPWPDGHRAHPACSLFPPLLGHGLPSRARDTASGAEL